MRAVIQRVSQAKVLVEKEMQAQINSGLAVLIGVAQNDDESDALYIAEKIANLRIFSDLDEKLNLSVKDVDGEVLVVSQFTLLGDARKGRRPSYAHAASAQKAMELYRQVIAELRKHDLLVSEGRFQEHMMVELVNDGPVTILLDSKKEF